MRGEQQPGTLESEKSRLAESSVGADDRLLLPVIFESLKKWQDLLLTHVGFLR
jgi:hypothetical protein